MDTRYFIYLERCVRWSNTTIVLDCHMVLSHIGHMITIYWCIVAHLAYLVALPFNWITWVKISRFLPQLLTTVPPDRTVGTKSGSFIFQLCQQSFYKPNQVFVKVAPNCWFCLSWSHFVIHLSIGCSASLTPDLVHIYLLCEEDHWSFKCCFSFSKCNEGHYGQTVPFQFHQTPEHQGLCA